MSYNLTNNIVFKGELSNNIIVEALHKTIQVYLDFYQVRKEDIPSFFTGTIFKESKNRNVFLVHNFFTSLIKKIEKNDFGKDIVNISFEINQLKESELLHLKIREVFSFNSAKSYSSPLRSALSVFLLILHLDRKIHLPFIFNIPYTFYSKDLKKVDFLTNYYPLMFKYIRSIDIKNKEDFDAKIMGLKSKELLVSYGSKLLLSLGWVNLQDVNLEDLLSFNSQIKKTDLKRFEFTPPISLMITFFNEKIKDFPISLEKWKESSKNHLKESKPKKSSKLKKIDFAYIASLIDEKDNNLFLSSIVKINKYFNVDFLDNIQKELPGYSQSIQVWKVLEQSYISKKKLENYSTLKNALVYLNMYLFCVLPRWFKKNKSRFNYPEEPNQLKAGVFISNLIKLDEPMPITLVDFLNEIKEIKNISNESVYIVLKNLESFFDFIQIYGDELPGCKGFTQPISSLDLPKITKSKGTNKGLIPRYMFSGLLNYIETIKEYNELVLEKIINHEISADIFKSNAKSYKRFIDTVKIQNIVGFIPMCYLNGEKVVLKDIPNLLDIKSEKLKDGRILDIPHPHLINHILVVLQTGLRNNHIQWLDAEKYNCAIKKDDSNIFVPLYVNTDKSKTSAWTPVVSKKVIDVLDSQIKWRNLIDNPKFNEKKFYNNNTKTKWESFYPLFSYKEDGLPYSDTSYYDAWLQILEFFDFVIAKTSLKKFSFGKRLPKGLGVNDFNLDVKINDYGKSCENLCEIRWISDITPHSARVSIISHYITALPADMIGQYVTGQTEAVVHHYVKLDPDYLTEVESGQKEALSNLAIKSEFNQLIGKEKKHPIFADKESSNLVQSMSISRNETIAQYGCVSLNLREGGKSGLDVLIENANIKIAFNKTEICPYNNICPSEIIKELKGLKRCGICPYAVRSIDHLPAIAVKKRQMMELLKDIESKLDEASLNKDKYTLSELEKMEEERQRITEELLGWIVSEEILEVNRKSLQSEDGKLNYLVKKPEILIANLQKVSNKESDIEYLLTRISDCDSFPDLDTPIIRAKIDLLRRSLLAKLGSFKEAFDMKIPVNPASECLGVIKEVVKRYDLNKEQVINLLSTDMLSLNQKNESIIGINYAK